MSEGNGMTLVTEKVGDLYVCAPASGFGATGVGRTPAEAEEWQRENAEKMAAFLSTLKYPVWPTGG